MSVLRTIEQGNENYFLQVKFESGITAIKVTDLKKIWQTILNEDELILQFKGDNPLIKSSDKWISEFVSAMIKNVQTSVKITLLDPDLSIIFSSAISSLSTKLNLILHLKTPEMMYKEITLPLLMTINELQYRQEKLLSILKSKDVEIKEFKFEGASITRKNAITEPFNLVNFDLECHTTLSDRAKNIIKNPCSAISSINSLYSEFSSVVGCMDIKEEEPENNSAVISNENNVNNSVIDVQIKQNDQLEFKRKASQESLSRIKRPKRKYKI